METDRDTSYDERIARYLEAQGVTPEDFRVDLWPGDERRLWVRRGRKWRRVEMDDEQMLDRAIDYLAEHGAFVWERQPLGLAGTLMMGLGIFLLGLAAWALFCMYGFAKAMTAW
ncbi:MAG: hypothetical protein GC159_12935 [Phycisphaera sp.]|nr:hypothetical protein [Phycisphaera sp.]